MVRKQVLIALLLALVAVPARAQQDGRAKLTLEDIHASAVFYPRPFQGGRWADEGPVITYIDRDRETGATHLISYNLESDRRTRLIDGNDLHAPDVDRLVEIEDYEYSPDGGKVLLFTDTERVWRYNTKGYYYVFDLDTGQVTPVADRADGFQLFAKFSPDGRRVGFVRSRDLFSVDLSSMQETRLTFDGAEGGVINGTTDWVYEEEFGLRDAWAWSPDGRHVAFLKLDESETRDFVMADLRGQYPDLVQFRYPKAGEANSEIRLGVIDVASGRQTFFDTGTWNDAGGEHEYLARLGWTPSIDGAYYVWAFRLNRDQNALDLVYGDPADGSIRVVLEEEEEAWVDVETSKLTYLDDGEHFVWRSATSGFDHLYLYRNDGTRVRQLTDGEWSVTAFHGVDEEAGRLYYTGTRESPLERHLYRSAFGRTTRSPERVTERPGTHGINMSRDLRYYIDAFSAVSTPLVTTLHRADGERIAVLQDNDALEAHLEAYGLRPPEFMRVPGADGTPLYATLIRPVDFDPSERYPLLVYTYGGPGNQEVRNAWGAGQGWSRYLWHQYLANEHGILVATVDNRGSGGRGRAFETAIYRRIGQLEAADQIAAAQWFSDQPYVDAARTGIWGWSYGGYLTLMSMLFEQGPETFEVGMAVAPVTDWRQYDTIYTERFLSTPQDNPAGYEHGAPRVYADRLRDDQELLLVHGSLDDNVHLQNAMQMVDALQAANRQFDLMVYPGRDHGIYGGTTRLHLFTMLTEYLQEHLAMAR